MKKLSVRISSLLLSIAMLFSLLPVSAFAADARAVNPTIPDYTQVTELRQIKADRKYLIVAQAPTGTLYALHLNAAGAGKNPGATAHPECTATLTVSGETVSAVSTANTSTSIAMSDLHVTITNTSGSSYTITNSTHALKLSDEMYTTAGSAPALPLAFTDDGRFAVTGSASNRYLTFNVKDAAAGQTHFPDHPTGFCGWNDPQTADNYYIPIYLFIYGDLPDDLGKNLSQMLTGDQIGGGDTPNENPTGQNSWVFTGGRAAQGSYDDIKGARTYAGHFEEYIRYTHAKQLKPTGEGDNPYLQRHVINAAYTGQTLQNIVDTFDTRIGALKPRAVSYLVDEGAGSASDFATNLNSLITKALALQGGTGMIVIETLTAADKAAVDAVVDALSEAQKPYVLPVLFTLTAAQKTGSYPNASGHLAMAKQLANAVVGRNVSSDKDWPYGVSAIASESVLGSGFPNRSSFSHNHGYTNPTTLSTGQQDLKKKMDTGTPMTWLFMGDSITHGAAWTGGYDSLPQLFEKFVKDDLKRTQDIVINAGSSGATVETTVSDLNRRLVKYSPDVVVLMLGTNNSNQYTSEDTFKTNLRTILDKIIAKGAVAVLRTPPPTSNDNYKIADFAGYVRDVAEEPKYDGKVILVDHYAQWFYNDWSKVYLRNKVHPDEAGHLWFAHQLIRELALWGDYNICKLEYVEMKEEKFELPGYTQITDVSQLAADQARKGYLIVSRDAKGNLYALYPSKEGRTLGAGDLPTPGGVNEGARTATLTVDEKKATVSAAWMKDKSALEMKNLLFGIKWKGNDQYEFTSFKGRRLNMQDGHMFTKGQVSLTVTGRGTAAPNAFRIRNASDSANRSLDFSRTGEYGAFHKGDETINTWGTDFWCPSNNIKMPIYLFACNDEEVKAPTAKEGLEALRKEVEALNPTDYTGASWKKLLDEIADAKAALASGNLDEDADIYVDAWDDLLEAYDNLNKRPAPPTVPTGATKLEVNRMIPDPGTSREEPFKSGTGGSANFRIPAIITLQHQTGANADKNGRLLAAADARWNHAGDACGLDTIVSYSDDTGATWKYHFANYFGDSTNTKQEYATAFIDPVLLEGNDGTVYLMVDVWPGGVALNTAPNRPANATGYEEIDGTKRLVLYAAAPNVSAKTYDYYVGDFVDGYAPIYEPVANGDDSFTGYYINEYYYLYHTSGAFSARNPSNDKIYCQRLGAANTWVQQNVFFYNATLHVRDASYLWIVKSTDGGQTWGKPQMINDQVRTDGDAQFYGVGPGAGLCMEDGTLILPTYTWPDEHAGFIYSTDGGENWKRGPYATEHTSSDDKTTSESCLVQINATTVRHFYRESWKQSSTPVAYTDYTWNSANNTWTKVRTGTVTDANHYGACQVSAIKYSEKIDGKDVILYSTPTGGSRASGKIYAFLVEDNTLTLHKTYAVNGTSVYAYSSLTETADGDIALLYEGTGNKIEFVVIPFADIVPTLTLNVTGYEGDYDGNPHTVIAKAWQGSQLLTNATLYYSADGTSWGNAYQNTYVYTNAGEDHTVYVKAEYNGLTATASATVKINQATPTLTITTDRQGYAEGDTATFTISGVPSKVTYVDDDTVSEIDGAIALRCSNDSTEDGHNPNIELTRQDDGTYTGSHVVKEGYQSFTASFTDDNGNYKPATATRNITVAPSVFGLNAQDVTCTYDSQPHSVTVTAAKDVTLTYHDAEDGEYTATKPTYINAGTYTTWFKAVKDGEEVTGSATLTINKATPAITFQCNHHEGTHGGGAEHSIETTELPLVLTIGGVPAGTEGQFTLNSFGDPVRNLTHNTNGTWTASPNLPAVDRTYIFTAAFDPTKTQGDVAIDNPNYNRVSATFTVEVERPEEQVIDFDFGFATGVVEDPQVDTRGTLTIEYDGAYHSPLEALVYDKYDKSLVLSYHVPDDGSRDTWTDTAPTFRQPGTYTVSVMASNGSVAKVLTVVLEIKEQRVIPTTLTITPSETELSGGGELTLTVGGRYTVDSQTMTGIPKAGTLEVTCDNSSVKITEARRGTYTVTLPDSDGSYTFTADYSGAGSYQAAHASCAVHVTPTDLLDFKLSSLEVKAGGKAVALSPAFSPDTLSYSAGVGSGVGSVTVTATAAASEYNPAVTVKKGGQDCADGVVTLNGSINYITVSVSNGPSTTNYRLTITRENDLTRAIAAAIAAKQGVTTSDAAANRVSKGTKFVTTAEMKALNDAIAAAQAVAGDANASADEVDDAVAALNAAVADFKAAIKTGTSTSSSNSSSDSSSAVTTSTRVENGISVTVTTAIPSASAKNGEAASTVSSAMGSEIVKQASNRDSDKVVIAPEIKGGVSRTEVSIPASTVEQIGSKTGASLTVDTPVASVTIPNSALSNLSKAGGDVKVTAEQTGNTVALTVTAGGKTVDRVPGGMKVTVPVAEPTPGTVAVLVREDGTRQVIRKSVVIGGRVTMPLAGSGKVEIVDNSKRFNDVPAASWAADAISFVSAHELFNGTGRAIFSPELTMSRGMLAVVLHNLEDNPSQALTGIFSDVDNAEWYAQGVAWAAKEGIVVGYGDGTFDPNGDITREQLAVMLWRYAGRPDVKNGTLNFIDGDEVSSWALEAMRWATEKGIINGKGNGVLDPTGKATRAQAAQMLKNFMEKQYA